MITALLRAILQLSDPALRRVIWFSVSVTGLGFAALAVATSKGLAGVHVTGILWLDAILDVLGGIAVLVPLVLLMPVALPAVSSLFLDDVVAAVERRHYPSAPPPRLQTLAELAGTTARFLAVSATLNLLVLPLYLIPGMNLIVFLVLNGILLGRNTLEQVAGLHLTPSAVRTLRQRHRTRVFLAGTVISGLTTVPAVNLIVPVIATAFMVHIFHALLDETNAVTPALPASCR